MTTTPITPVATDAPATTDLGTAALRAGRSHPFAILTIVCVSYFMVILDNSIIFTGLPSIEAAMSLSPTGLAWVQDAYTLVFGGLLLLGARSGDILGRRRVFTFGLVVFATASLLVGAAPTGWWLIGARALQGIGAAVLAPSALSLLTASFPEGRERTRAVAAYSAVAGLGASLGLVVGGVLADLVSWRAGFLLNVPIGIAMILAGRRYLAETESRRGRFDLPGAVLATLGTGALVFGIVESSTTGWASARTIVALLVGVAALAGFVVNERRAEQPIMPLRLFANRTRSGAYLVRALYLGAMITFFFFTTQLLQGVWHFSPLQAGIAFLPMSAVNFVVALLVSRWTRRFGATPVLVTGVVLTLVGMAWLSRAGIGDGYLLTIAAPMVLIGAGQGLAFAPMTAAGLAGVDPSDAGAASGVVNTAHQLGSSLGLGIAVAVSTAAAADLTDGVAALAERVDVALLAGTAMLALALLVTITTIRRSR